MAPHNVALLVAAVSKHHLVGIIGIVLGALVVLYAGLRVVQRASAAALTGLTGVVIVVLGVLVYTRTIKG